MDFNGRTCVIVGAARGVGADIARQLAAKGAKVAVVDRDEAGASAVAAEFGGLGIGSDIADKGYEAPVIELVRRELGEIDLWFTNAGVSGSEGFLEIDEDEWDRLWAIHVKSHVRAARALLPRMLERGEGYLAQTASGVALSLQLTQSSYSVTKHAALALNEWLHVNYRRKGIRVSCFCPLGMKTDMIRASLPTTPSGRMAWETAMEPADAAATVVRGLEEERMLILSHPQVLEAFRSRGTDHDAWLADPLPHYRQSREAQARKAAGEVA